MKEEEAKYKSCPQVRIADCGANNAVAVNREYGDEEITTRCIASGCMMWVQDTSYWAKDGTRVKIEDTHQFRTPEDGGFETITEGHCGLMK